MVKIRKAKKEDIDQILKLIKFGVKAGQVLLRSKKEIEGVLDCFFITEIKGKIVGYCSLEVYSPKLAELRSLVVDCDYQNQGIGSGLVKACIKEARKRKVYEILSITDKISFFGKFGFFNQLGNQSPLFKRLKKR